MKSPIIETSRLILSLLTLEDIPLFTAYRNDPEISWYQSWFPVTEQAVRELVLQHQQISFGTQDQWFQFGLRRKTDQLLIGDIGIHFLDDQFQSAEIGYAIALPYQRQGFAQESVEAMLNFCFTKTPLIQINATCDDRNTASILLLEKVGFIRQNIRPNAIHLRGEWCTEVDFNFIRQQRSQREIFLIAISCNYK